MRATNLRRSKSLRPADKNVSTTYPRWIASDISAARHGHHRFGYGMCGFSAAIPESKDDRLYISAPGVWYWQGALFVQNVNEQEQRPNTLDGPGETDHSMLGRRSFSSVSYIQRNGR
jgi:hypothetical protein